MTKVGYPEILFSAGLQVLTALRSQVQEMNRMETTMSSGWRKLASLKKDPSFNTLTHPVEATISGHGLSGFVALG